MQRLLLYLGFLIAAIALVRGPLMRRLLEPVLVLGAFVVVGYGLSERMLPKVIDLASSGTAVGRLEQPLTYWNAEGLLAAVGLVLAVHIAGDPVRERAVRAAAAAAAVLLGLGVYLTYARGALAAAAVGLVVLVALAPGGAPAAARDRHHRGRDRAGGAGRQRPLDRQVAVRARSRRGARRCWSRWWR